MLATDILPQEQQEFDKALSAAVRREMASPIPERWVNGRRVVWAPQPGSQEAFLSCPLFECLYHGTRGPGKTDSLLMDYAQHIGRGYGEAWRGILFRQTYPQLADVVAKSQRWFRRIFPSARFLQSGPSGMSWRFETGEVLLLRHIRKPEDYWLYHGHEYTWIGFEELTNWTDDSCYRSMFSCCRSSVPTVPLKVRATTNPYGVGHNWVKRRFRLNGDWRKTVVVRDSKDLDGNLEPPRAAIHGHLRENKILLAASPNYASSVTAAATNKEMAKAWRDGDWNVVSGGMFDDVWSPKHNLVPRFNIPDSWRVDRSFDWGSSRPFSVGWYAQSDGSDLRLANGRVMSTVRGDLFRIAEWYGWTGRENEGLRALAVDVARGIVERELMRGWRRSVNGQSQSRVSPGPADSAIYTVENGRSIALDMEKPVRIGNEVYPGISWLHADKRPGSRKSGWEQFRAMIAAATPPEGRPREAPGFFVVEEENPQFLRTVLALPRDEKDPDDVNTDAEDHIADETRYRIRASGSFTRSGSTVGLH